MIRSKFYWLFLLLATVIIVAGPEWPRTTFEVGGTVLTKGSCPFALTTSVNLFLAAVGFLGALILGWHYLADTRTWQCYLFAVGAWGVVMLVRFGLDLYYQTPIGGSWPAWLQAWGAEGFFLIVSGTILYV